MPAQALFEALPATAEFSRLSGSAFAVADVDGDGDPDVVAGSRLHLNDGRGRYQDVSSAAMPPLGGEPRWIQAIDLNGDGAVELLLLVDATLRVLEGDGRGHFLDVSASHLPTNAHSCLAVAVEDVDGDGDPDLALGRSVDTGRGWSGLQNLLYLNDGTGRFLDVTGAGFLPAVENPTSTVLLADLDGDSVPDLVFGNHAARGTPPSEVLVNDGTGRFTAVGAPALPQPDLRPWAVRDLDGDGNQDLVSREGLFWGDGRAGFVRDAALPGLEPGFTLVEDLDSDGDLDVLVAAACAAGRGARAFLNSGARTFVEAGPERGLDRLRGVVAAVDWDADGDQDLLCGAGIRHLNGGQGVFHATWRDSLPAPPDGYRNYGQGSAVADFDGDGTADIAFGDVLLLGAEGAFVDRTESLLPPISVVNPLLGSSDLQVCDLDLDGDPDLVRCAFGMTQLLINDGTGRFSVVRLPAEGHAVAAADVDGDGDPDLVFAAHGRDTLWLNDGSGGFVDATAGRLPDVAGTGAAVVAADVDADGSVDLVFANGGFDPSRASVLRNRLFRNDGSGRFRDVTSTHLPAGSSADHSSSVAVGDLNGDGAVDLLFGNAGQDQLLFNDGQGGFRDVSSSHLPPLGATRDVAFGDFDEDGDLDAVVAQQFAGGQGTPVLLVNDGSGHFRDANGGLVDFGPWVDASGGGVTASVLLDDVDRDGDADLLLGVGRWPTSGQPGSGSGAASPRAGMLFRNLRRQLSAPRFARVGEAYTLRLDARGDRPGTRADVGFVLLGNLATSFEIPGLGIVGIDLQDAVALPPKLVPAGGQSVDFVVGVPDVPALVGTPVLGQAAVLSWPSMAGLTNVTFDQLLR